MRPTSPSLALTACLLATACGNGSTDGTGGTGTGGSLSNATGVTSATGTTTTTSGTQSTSSGTSSSSSGMMGTAGCGQALSEPTGQWNAKAVDVGGTMRDYFVYLPAGYDPARAYPVVYQFHGCSTNPDKESNNVPIETESKGDAIIVRGRAVGNCWDTSNNGPDVAFFDAMVTAIDAGYCADAKHRFIAGYSSGSFMTHLLACARGAELRGVASIAGGQTGSNCTGKVAALLIHDANDPTVNISASQGARDQYLAANGCSMTTTPFDPAPCVAYDGCAAGLPVVWCQTAGKGHDRQDGLAAPAFWNFFSTL